MPRNLIRFKWKSWRAEFVSLCTHTSFTTFICSPSISLHSVTVQSVFWWSFCVRASVFFSFTRCRTINSTIMSPYTQLLFTSFFSSLYEKIFIINTAGIERGVESDKDVQDVPRAWPVAWTSKWIFVFGLANLSASDYFARHFMERFVSISPFTPHWAMSSIKAIHFRGIKGSGMMRRRVAEKDERRSKSSPNFISPAPANVLSRIHFRCFCWRRQKKSSLFQLQYLDCFFVLLLVFRLFFTPCALRTKKIQFFPR